MTSRAIAVFAMRRLITNAAAMPGLKVWASRMRLTISEHAQMSKGDGCAGMSYSSSTSANSSNIFSTTARAGSLRMESLCLTSNVPAEA